MAMHFANCEINTQSLYTMYKGSDDRKLFNSDELGDRWIYFTAS